MLGRSLFRMSMLSSSRLGAVQSEQEQTKDKIQQISQPNKTLQQQQQQQQHQQQQQQTNVLCSALRYASVKRSILLINRSFLLFHGSLLLMALLKSLLTLLHTSAPAASAAARPQLRHPYPRSPHCRRAPWRSSAASTRRRTSLRWSKR